MRPLREKSERTEAKSSNHMGHDTSISIVGTHCKVTLRCGNWLGKARLENEMQVDFPHLCSASRQGDMLKTSSSRAWLADEGYGAWRRRCSGDSSPRGCPRRRCSGDSSPRGCP